MAGGEHVGGATRDDVAKLAEVSSATVSRAYNRPSSVSPEKLQRIRAAAKSLGYKPDLNASCLRRKGSGAILLALKAPALEDSSEGRVYRWFYAEALICAQAALDGGSFQLRVGLRKSKEPLKRFLERNACDGVVLGLGSFREEELKALESMAIPHVLCSQMEMASVSSLCYIDERAGGALAAKSLLKAGRKRLAHISGNMADVPVCAARWEGFRERAMKDGPSPLLIDGALGIAGGRESGLKLAPLVKRGEVDGLFVVNDLTAVGVMQGLLEKGVSIPSDLALVAYDNLPFREAAPVGMASVDVSIGRLYGTAVELMAEILRGEIPEGEAKRTAIAPVLVKGPSLPEGGVKK